MKIIDEGIDDLRPALDDHRTRYMELVGFEGNENDNPTENGKHKQQNKCHVSHSLKLAAN